MTYEDELDEILGEIKEDSMPKLDEYVLDFGKYKGQKLIDIAEMNPGYISWAKENIGREPIRSLLEQL